MEIVERIASVPGVADLAMTTNGILLPRLARPLREAGLRRINIHVDTLHPERLKRIMRFGTLEEIEAGIAAAEAAGLLPIKINVVVTRDYNDMDVVDLARRALDRDWHVRFIELMPLGGGETAHVAAVAVRAVAARRGGGSRTRSGPSCPCQREPRPTRRSNYRFETGRAGSWASSAR